MSATHPFSNTSPERLDGIKQPQESPLRAHLGPLEGLNYWRDLSQINQDTLKSRFDELKRLTEQSHHELFERIYLARLARLPADSARREVLIQHFSLTLDIERPKTQEDIADLLIAARQQGGARCVEQVKVTLLAYGRLDDHDGYLETYRDLITLTCSLYQSLDGPGQLLVSALLNYSHVKHPKLHSWVKDELKALIVLGKDSSHERQLDRLIYLVHYAVPAMNAYRHTPEFEELLKKRWRDLLSLIDEGELLLEQAILTHPGLWRFITQHPDDWLELLSFADVFALEVFEGKLSKTGDLKRHLSPLTRRSNIGLDLVTRYMKLSVHPEFVYRSAHQWVYEDPELFNEMARWLTSCQPGQESSCDCNEAELRRCLAKLAPSSTLNMTGMRREIKPPERLPVIGAIVELGQRSQDGRDISMGLLMECVSEVVDLIPNPIGKTIKGGKIAVTSAAKRVLKEAVTTAAQSIAKKSKSAAQRVMKAGKSKIRSFILNNNILTKILRRPLTMESSGHILITLQSLHSQLSKIKEMVNETVSLNNLIKKLAEATNTRAFISPSIQSGALSIFYQGELKPHAELLAFLASHPRAVKYIDSQLKDALKDQLKEIAHEVASDLMPTQRAEGRPREALASYGASFEAGYLFFKIIQDAQMLENK